MPGDLAAKFQERQSAVARGAAAATVRALAGVDPLAVLASWRELLPAVVRLTAAAELSAAAAAQPYVAAQVAAQGAEVAASLRLVPAAFVETEVLAAYLMSPALDALRQMERGRPAAQAVSAAKARAGLIARTQVSFAGSDAVSVAMVAEPNVGGWTRVLSLPSCGRCAVLAGRVYKWNDGFRRHPGCDCSHQPLTASAMREPLDAADVRTNPRAYFDSLSEAEQNRHFGAKVAQEIRDGKELGRAVNADNSTWRSRYPHARRLPKRSELDRYLRGADGDRAAALKALRADGFVI